MTATYWEIGRRIVQHEQGGKKRAGYGEALSERLGQDLENRFGGGFSVRSIRKMRQFFLRWLEGSIRPALWAESKDTSPGDEIVPTLWAKFNPSSLTEKAPNFPLPWSHHVRLMTLSSEEARRFYETEALRCGWSVRQLERQVAS